MSDREVDIKAATAYYTIPAFKFVNGDVLDIKIAYASLNPGASKVALVPTCYSGRLNTTLTFSSSVAGLNALASHHVIVVAMLGNGESSSPSNTPNFPSKLDYRDQIRAQHRLVTEGLGITNLDVVAGFSMGGQQTFHWAAMYPDMVRNAVVICGSARTSAHNHAFIDGPLSALASSSDFMGGKYKENGIESPLIGLKALARTYAGWLYSADFFRNGLWKKLSGKETMAEYMEWDEQDWLTWDANNLLIKGRCWQNADVGVVGGGFEKTLEGIKARVLLMPAQTDQYFRPEDNEIELRYLKDAELAVIPSVWGHAAGGGANPEDNIWMDRRISEFLAKA